MSESTSIIPPRQGSVCEVDLLRLPEKICRETLTCGCLARPSVKCPKSMAFYNQARENTVHDHYERMLSG